MALTPLAAARRTRSSCSLRRYVFSEGRRSGVVAGAAFCSPSETAATGRCCPGRRREARWRATTTHAKPFPLRRDIDVLGGGGAVGVDTHDDTARLADEDMVLKLAEVVVVVVVVVVVRKEASEVRNACRQGSMAWFASKGGDERSQLPSWAGLADRLVARPHRASEGGGAHCPAAGIQSLCLFWRLFFFWLSNSFPAQEEERGDLFGNAAAGSMRSELRRQCTNAPTHQTHQTHQ